jgi:hypothetical protein
VEVDSLPLHIVGQEPLATERQVAQLVAQQPALQQLYSGWVASLHPAAWKEAELMARTAGKRLKFDIRPAIEMLGWEEVLKQVGVDRVIQELRDKKNLKRLVANLSPAERKQLKDLL